MTTEVFSARVNSTPVLLVQFFDPATGDPIDLTGATSLSAKLTAEAFGGAELSAAPCTLFDGPTGKVQCGFDLTDAVVGVYRLTVILTDADSLVQRYPLRAGQLLVDVTSAT